MASAHGAVGAEGAGDGVGALNSATPVFVGGRILHSTVQILSTNIRLRGLVYTINFLAVLGLWSRLLVF